MRRLPTLIFVSLLVVAVDAKSLHALAPKEPPEHKPVPPQRSIAPSPRRLTASMPAPSKLRPSFTAILWGCGMALWPRMLQHVHSHVDGDVSVAALRMPAEAGPFVKAIFEICAPLFVGHSARPLVLLSVSADGVHCAAVRLADTTDAQQRARMVFYGKPTKHLGKPHFVEMAHTARPDLGSVSGG